MSFAQRRNRRIKLVIPLLIVIIGAAVVGSQITAAQSPTAQPIAGAPSSLNLADPAQATVRFMQAYYTADYRQRDQWLAALKPLASTDGYTLLENMIAPALWPNLEKTQTIVAADQVTGRRSRPQSPRASRNSRAIPRGRFAAWWSRSLRA